MRLRHRLELHRALRSIGHRGLDQGGLCLTALGHDDALAVLEQRLENRMTAEAPGLLTAGGITGFFQWVLDHAQQIIALVTEILKMFGL